MKSRKVRKLHYTCPTLMAFAGLYAKIRLFRTHIVRWKYPEDGCAYILVSPRSSPGYGWQLSCPYPRWMILSEIYLRRCGFYLSMWFKHPFKMARKK